MYRGIGHLVAEPSRITLNRVTAVEHQSEPGSWEIDTGVCVHQRCYHVQRFMLALGVDENGQASRVSCRLPSRHVAEYPPVEVQVPCTVCKPTVSRPGACENSVTRDGGWLFALLMPHPGLPGPSNGAERWLLIGRTVEKLRRSRKIGQASDTSRQSLGG